MAIHSHSRSHVLGSGESWRRTK